MTDLIDTTPLKPVYLLELTARAPGGVAVSGRTDYGDLAYGETPTVDVVPAGTVVFYIASEGYITAPGDTPANKPYKMRNGQPFAVERQVAIAPGESGIVTMSLGSIVLLNDDGELDQLVRDYAVDGRMVAIKRVDRGAAYSTAVTLFTGAAAGWGFASRNTVALELRGQVYRLGVPLQPTLYAGTGDAEGGADLKGKPKPLAYGKPRNVTMALVAPSILLFQAHDGPIQAVDAVYDGAVALTFQEDKADYAALAALSVASGKYATCLAEGFVKVGSPPVYGITADIQGDKSDGTFRTSTADIVRHWLESRLGIDTSEIDGDAFDDLATLQPAVCDRYFDTPVAAGDAIAEFMAGIGAWLGETTDGKFTCRRFDAPGTPTADIDESVITKGGGFGALPENVSPVIWRIGVEYGQNWTLQDSGIDGVNITAARRSFVSQDVRVEYAADAALVATYTLAVDHPPVRAFFNDQADAAAEATRLQELWGVPRRIHVLPTKAADLRAELGDTIRYTSSRYGLSAGVPVVVIGQEFDARANQLILTVLE